MDSRRPGVTNFVHVGLVVEDLDETVRFLALLGFDCGEPGMFSGEWIDRIIGLENVTVEVVMARRHDGSAIFEVVRFRSPSTSAHESAPGIRGGRRGRAPRTSRTAARQQQSRTSLRTLASLRHSAGSSRSWPHQRVADLPHSRKK